MPFNTFGTMHMTSGLMQTADVKRCVCVSAMQILKICIVEFY